MGRCGVGAMPSVAAIAAIMGKHCCFSAGLRSVAISNAVIASEAKQSPVWVVGCFARWEIASHGLRRGRNDSGKRRFHVGDHTHDDRSANGTATRRKVL